MNNRNTTLWLGLATIVLMVSSAPMGIIAQETGVAEQQFEVYLLTPNTNQNREDWSTLIQGELPKGGIGITDNVFVGFDIIGSRSFSYPVNRSDPTDSIPTHRNAGFDLAFVGLSGALSYDPTGSYSNQTLSPEGLNFASYKNAEVSQLIAEYRAELDDTARAAIAKDIQAILYEDQPYIPIINTQGLWAHDTDLGLSQDDILLLSTVNYAMGWANISHPTDTNLVYAHSYTLHQFHPFVSNEYFAAAYQTPILPGLFERSASDPFTWEPALAASLPVAQDGGVNYTVEIRPDAEFYYPNGTRQAVTAFDVANTYHMHMDEDIGSFSRGDVLPFIGNETQVQALNATHVKFTFDNPYFNAYGIMSLGIMAQDVIGTPASPAATDFNDIKYVVGAGPFYYDAAGIDLDQNTLTIQAVPNWWGGSIGASSLTFEQHNGQTATTAIQNGNVHIIDSQITYDKAILEGKSGVKLDVIADFGTQFLTVNMDHPILGTGVDTPLGKQDPSRAAEGARHVRKAISHLIPRDTIVNEIAEGRATAATSLWPDVAFGYDDTLQVYEYSVAKAIAEMEAAGYTFPEEDDDTGLPFMEIVPVTLAAVFSAFVLMDRRRR